MRGFLIFPNYFTISIPTTGYISISMKYIFIINYYNYQLAGYFYTLARAFSLRQSQSWVAFFMQCVRPMEQLPLLWNSHHSLHYSRLPAAGPVGRGAAALSRSHLQYPVPGAPTESESDKSQCGPHEVNLDCLAEPPPCHH